MAHHRPQEYMTKPAHPDTFARRLRALREAAGLSVPQLAERAGLPRTAVWKLENGQSRPFLETAQKLVKALGVSLSEFE